MTGICTDACSLCKYHSPVGHKVSCVLSVSRKGKWPPLCLHGQLNVLVDSIQVVKEPFPPSLPHQQGLVPENISHRFIRRINSELDWLCSVRDCLMVDGSCWLGKFDIARDGIHLNRRGAKKFGNLLCKVINSCTQGNI
jgi:hypothetical protein